MERSAPSETALRSALAAASGPIVTATISSTSIAPPSLSCIAASMACVSKGLSRVSPPRSRRPVEGLMRFTTPASGTLLTRTQIFTGSLLVPRQTFAHPSALTDESIASGQLQEPVHDLRPQLARGRPQAQQLGEPE